MSCWCDYLRLCSLLRKESGCGLTEWAKKAGDLTQSYTQNHTPKILASKLTDQTVCDCKKLIIKNVTRLSVFSGYNVFICYPRGIYAKIHAVTTAYGDFSPVKVGAKTFFMLKFSFRLIVYATEFFLRCWWAACATLPVDRTFMHTRCKIVQKLTHSKIIFQFFNFFSIFSIFQFFFFFLTIFSIFFFFNFFWQFSQGKYVIHI